MPKIFSNSLLKSSFKNFLISQVQKLSVKPVLHIVQIGDNLASTKYVGLKQRFGAEIGVEVLIHKLDLECSEKVVAGILDQIKKQKTENLDCKVGLIFQLPIPARFQKFVDQINSGLDVDLLGKKAFDLWDKGYLPPTIGAVDLVLKEMMSELKLDFKLTDADLRLALYKSENADFETILNSSLDFTNQKVAVVGQGVLVGKPMTQYLLARNAEVVCIDKETINPQNLTRDCIILITAAGKANLINQEWLKTGIIVDVATSEEGGFLVGDVDANSLDDSIFLCPSPGGVGPLTVYFLFWNLIKFA